MGEFGSTTHMADGEDHTHNKGVTNRSSFGEEAGEKKGGGGGGGKKQVLVSFKGKDTAEQAVFKKNKNS